MERSASELIQDFSGKFLAETSKPYRRSLDTQILTKLLPEVVESELKLRDAYRVYGSVGSGNWSEIPWLAVIDRSISDSTTRGYYIVLLFDKSLKNIYLCLGVGWTQFAEEFGSKDGKLKMRTTCEHYADLLNVPPGFRKGVIDLDADHDLGKGYEEGEIIFKKYSVSELSDKILFDDMRHLINVYQELKTIVGSSILNLDVDSSDYDETVSNFKKKVAAESLYQYTAESLARLIKTANEAPPGVRSRLIKEIARNRKFAQYVKERAGFVCEICNRKPFIQENGKPYAEADHIVPLGGKTKGLDSPDNMRCLCPQCHAIITHGSDEEIEKLISGS